MFSHGILVFCENGKMTLGFVIWSVGAGVVGARLALVPAERARASLAPAERARASRAPTTGLKLFTTKNEMISKNCITLHLTKSR
jgi:hypothetical protein